MNDLGQKKWRKIVFIYPRLQGGAVLAFAAVVVAAGSYFTWHIDRDVRQALWDVSLTAHYHFRSAYDVVGAAVVRHVGALLAGTALAGAALLLLGALRVRLATRRIVEAFRRMEDGDLSTPAGVTGPGEFASVGRQVDEVRARTQEIVGEVRAEVDRLRKQPLADEEFLGRWTALKEKIGRLAP